jgi:hypothetical protein
MEKYFAAIRHISLRRDIMWNEFRHVLANTVFSPCFMLFIFLVTSLNSSNALAQIEGQECNTGAKPSALNITSVTPSTIPQGAHNQKITVIFKETGGKTELGGQNYSSFIGILDGQQFLGSNVFRVDGSFSFEFTPDDALLLTAGFKQVNVLISYCTSGNLNSNDQPPKGVSVIKPSNDYNSDGKPDLIWQNQATGEIVVWFMNGATRVSPSPFSPGQVTDLNWKIVGAADFNSDGKPDLVWQHQATGAIGVWFMNGATRISPSFFSPAQVPDTNWKIVGVADFNSDGQPDLVWQHQATGLIGVWFMNGISQASWSFFSPAQVPDTNWKIVGAADFDSDGQPDLVWQHQATGELVVWYMNGSSLSRWSYFSPSQMPDTNWKIPNLWALAK